MGAGSISKVAQDIADEAKTADATNTSTIAGNNNNGQGSVLQNLGQPPATPPPQPTAQPQGSSMMSTPGGDVGSPTQNPVPQMPLPGGATAPPRAMQSSAVRQFGIPQQTQQMPINQAKGGGK